MFHDLSNMDFKTNCLSYWYPTAQKAGIHTPETMIFKANDAVVDGIRNAFWMKPITQTQKNAIHSFLDLVKLEARRIKYPLFLRSGQTSHKHDWGDTCFVSCESSLVQNIQNIAEMNIMADMNGGLPIDIWVIREMIKTKPYFYAFNNMPITKERRYFVRDGKVEEHFPYWPKNAFENLAIDKDWENKLEQMNAESEEEVKELTKLSRKVAKRFDGYWSMDWLQASNGDWYLIDMALGENSYHLGHEMEEKQEYIEYHNDQSEKV